MRPRTRIEQMIRCNRCPPRLSTRVIAGILTEPGGTFLMVAIRNLYWTGPLTAFIVGGLIQFAALCGSLGRRRGVRRDIACNVSACRVWDYGERDVTSYVSARFASRFRKMFCFAEPTLGPPTGDSVSIFHGDWSALAVTENGSRLINRSTQR